MIDQRTGATQLLDLRGHLVWQWILGQVSCTPRELVDLRFICKRVRTEVSDDPSLVLHDGGPPTIETRAQPNTAALGMFSLFRVLTPVAIHSCFPHWQLCDGSNPHVGGPLCQVSTAHDPTLETP
jgi:hypothetical protein